MADIALKIKSDFGDAERDIKNLEGLSESAKKQIGEFTKGFKAERIEEFISSNRQAAAGVKITGGEFKALQSEAKGLEKEIKNLVKQGLDPNSEQMKILEEEYRRITGTIDDKKAAMATLKEESENQKKILEEQTQAEEENKDAIDDKTSTIKNAITQIGLMAAAYMSLRAVKGILTGLTTDLAAKGDEIGKTAGAMGIASEELQTYRYIAESAGVASSTVTTALQDMNVQVGRAMDEQGKLYSLLKDTNPELLEQVKGADSSSEAFDLLTRAAADMENPMQQAAFAQAAFGGAGKEMLKVIDLGAEGIDELTDRAGMFGDVMSQDATDAAEEFTQAQEELKKIIDGLVVSIGTKLMKPLADMMNAVINLFTDTDRLNNILVNTGIVVGGLAVGLGVYAVASGAAATASAGLVTALLAKVVAVKALTVAMLMNPIGLIAVGVSLAVIAIGVLIKNIDTVAFHVTDFAQTAKIMLLELAKDGIGVLIDGVGKVTGVLGKVLPGAMGEAMQAASEMADGINESIDAEIAKTIEMQDANRAAYAVTQEIAEEELEQKQLSTEQKIELDEQVIESGQRVVEEAILGLEQLQLSEEAAHQMRIDDALSFLEQRADLESRAGADRLAFLRAQMDEIENIEFESQADRIAAEQALTQAIKEEHAARRESAIALASSMVGSMAGMASDIAAVQQNMGKNSAKAAKAARALGVAESIIETYIAASRAASATATFGPIASGAAAAVVIAAGTARTAKIATTPIPSPPSMEEPEVPSAQTGLDRFTVPDSGKNDGFGVRASAGETVTVEPRGEEQSQNMEVNIQIGEDTLIKVIQRFIDTGKININDRNVGQGVFA